MLVCRSVPIVPAEAGLLGMGAGMFVASNWVLGTDLVPSDEAGCYLGISSLADAFSAFRPRLGYQVILALYGALFLVPALVLAKVKLPEGPATG
jgi:hypothetical protein